MLGFQGTRLISVIIFAHVAVFLPQPGIAYQPEGPSGFTKKQAVKSKRFMIAAANPHAVRAGYEILKNGGSATDAVKFKAALKEKGHSIRVRHLTSGLHGIEITPKTLVGGADPRREGIVMGD